MNNSFNTAKNEFRWRLVKRKKQVINFCMALAFTMAFAVPGYSLAVPASDATPVFTGDIPGSGTTNHVLDTTVPTAPVLNIQMNNAYTKSSYSTYNIGSAATVNISGGGVYVAKIDGSHGASEIFGHLNASGVAVFLMNTAGITFGGGSQVNVGSLVATTSDDVDVDDVNNPSMFTFSGFGNAAVVNNGDITVNDGGWAILAAPQVENNGTITVGYDVANSAGGHIELASTDQLNIGIGGGNVLITYSTPASVVTGAGVKNTGTLSAKSGTINISANVASDIVQGVVNLDGVIDADSFDTTSNGGTILVSAEAADVKVANTAVISAKGGSTSGNGGTVTVDAAHVNFAGSVDASATSGTNGKLVVNADAINVDGTYNSSATDSVLGSSVESASANGTNVELNATGDAYINSGLSLKNGDLKVTGDSITLSGSIVGLSSGNGVNVDLESVNDLDIGFADITLQNGGNIKLVSTAGDVTGSSMLSISKTSTVDGDVISGGVDIAANAGNVWLGNILVDQRADTGLGNSVTSYVSITADGYVITTGSIISSAVSKAGSAGVGDSAATSSVYLESFNDSVDVGTGGIISTATAFDANNAGGAFTSSVLSASSLNLQASNGDISVSGPVSLSSWATSINSGTGVASSNVLSASDATLNASGAVVIGNPFLGSGVAVHSIADNEANVAGISGSQANLTISAGSLNINSAGSVDVYSSAHLNNGDSAAKSSSAANVAIATDSDVLVERDVSVVSNAYGSGSNPANIVNSDSSASLDLQSTNGSVTVNGIVQVNSTTQNHAYLSSSASALADALIEAKNDITTNSITVTSAVDQQNSAIAVSLISPVASYLELNTTDGSVVVNGDVYVSAEKDVIAADGAIIGGSSSASVFVGTVANLSINAGTDVTLNNLELRTDSNITTNGTAYVDSPSSDLSAIIFAGNGELTVNGGVSLTSDITVTGAVQGTVSSKSAGGFSSVGDTHIDGNISKISDVWISSGGSSDVEMDESLEILSLGAGSNIAIDGFVSTQTMVRSVSTGHGNIIQNVGILSNSGDTTIGGYVENGIESKVTGSMSRSDVTSNYRMGAANDLNIGGDIASYVYASAAQAQAINRVDLKQLFAPVGGDINVQGTVNVVSEVTGTGSYVDFTGATSFFDVEADGNVLLNGPVAVSVNVDDTSGSYSSNSATLKVSSVNGDITINGNVSVSADLDTTGLGSYAYLGADTRIEAGNNLSVDGNITVSTNSNVDGSSGTSSAHSELRLKGFAGDVNVTGNVKMSLDSQINTGSMDAWGYSTMSVYAGNDIIIGNGLTLSSDVLSFSSGDTFSTAQADISADAGDLSITGGVDFDSNLLSLAGEGQSYSGDVNLDGNITVDTDSGTIAENVSSYDSLYIQANSNDVIINGDISVNAASHTVGGSAVSSVDVFIDAANDVNIVGNTSISDRASVFNGTGDAFVVDYSDIEAGNNISITGNVLLSSYADDSFAAGAADVFSSADLQAGNNITVVGDITTLANAVGNASSVADSDSQIVAGNNGAGSVDVTGNISLQATSAGGFATASLEVAAPDNVFIQGNDPLVVANSNVLQQQTSGSLSDATGTADLVLSGSSVRFFDATGYDAAGFDRAGYNAAGYDVNGYDINGFDINGFNAAGINKDTGTLYNLAGYDVNGYDINGFNAAGIHKDTGTKYNLAGFDMFGNFNPALLLSRSDIITILSAGNLGSEEPALGGLSGSVIQNIAPAGEDACNFMNCGTNNGENV